MGYWGWRPLVIGLVISVLVIGCSATSDYATSSPPTQLPSVTLIVRSPQPRTPTPTPGLPMIATPQDIAKPPIELPQPACYRQNNDSILCLGLAQNTLTNTALGRVVLNVSLLDSDGDVVENKDRALLQRIVPAQDSAPYHVLFTTPLADFGGVQLDLLRADPITGADRLDLTITDDSGALVDGRYVVSGTLNNETGRDARDIHIVATLHESNGRLTGYRIHPIPTLNHRSNQSFDIAIQSQVVSDDLVYRLFVDARATSRSD